MWAFSGDPNEDSLKTQQIVVKMPFGMIYGGLNNWKDSRNE